MLTGLLSAATAVAAEPDPVALVWTAPTECPSGDAVHDRIEKALGTPTNQLAPVAAVVTVSQGVGRWQASMILHSHGERSDRAYDAESCDALAEATALIVALAAEGQDGRPTPSSGPPPSQRREGDQAIVAPERVWTTSSLFVQGSLTFDHGTMPYSYSPGFELGAGKLWNASIWRLRLFGGASYFLTETGSNEGNDGQLGRFWLLTFGVRGCVTAVLGPFELGPCVGAELALIHGNDVGGTSGSSDSQYWLSPIGGVMTALNVAPKAALFARAELAVPTTQRTVMGSPNATSVNPVYDIPSHATRVMGGIEIRFF